MLRKQTIATFAIPIMILALSPLSSMIHPVRATKMTLYSAFQTWQDCVGSNTVWSTWVYYGNGPLAKTWVISVSIWLDGGDLTQYATWDFILFDGPDNGNLLISEYSDGEIHYVTNNERFSGTLTGSLADAMNVQLTINNADPVSQCFKVQATSWYY
jgi:hypothetical protein